MSYTNGKNIYYTYRTVFNLNMKSHDTFIQVILDSNDGKKNPATIRFSLLFLNRYLQMKILLFINRLLRVNLHRLSLFLFPCLLNSCFIWQGPSQKTFLVVKVKILNLKSLTEPKNSF